ncbi:MAG: AAA family ATPase, partial [Sandaracinaceae bacterium]|nr:AAA family ATPase [Sandaracinaceae bacterium]
MSMPCPYCGFANPRAWRACARCGRSLSSTPLVSGRAYLSAGDATVVGAAPEPPTLDQPLDQPLDTQPPEELEPPLIGQIEAARTIHSAIETAFTHGRPTLVVLEGGRGSGKTRLLFYASEVASRLSATVRVLYGGCRAEGGDGYYAPFGRLLLERFGVTPSSSPAVVRAQMTTVVTEALQSSDAITIAETTHLLGFISGVPFPDSPFLREDDPAQLRTRAVAAFRRFVAGDARRQPLLLLLDNMHAAEPDAFELLAAALGAEGPLAVVMAGAPPLTEQARALGAAGGVATGPIAPLAGPDVAAMMQVLLPTLIETPEPVVAALTHRSGGNPSALRELVFALLEAGLFVRGPTGMAADLAKLESGLLPVTTADAINARL